MQEDGLVARAGELGTRIREAFESAFRDVPGFVEMRGKGLMMGIALDRPCGAIVKDALEAGLVLNVTADTVVRLLPPLIFSDDDAGELVDKLVPVVRNFLMN